MNTLFDDKYQKYIIVRTAWDILPENGTKKEWKYKAVFQWKVFNFDEISLKCC